MLLRSARLFGGAGERVEREDLQRYLHEHIPLSAAMGVEVVSARCDSVVLAAPLAPNINHRDTVFGGSASALAILSAWALVHGRIAEAGVAARLVIQRNTMSYDAPMCGVFTARSFLSDAEAWDRFMRALTSKGRARVAVSSVLECEGTAGGCFAGDFVAVRLD